MKRAAVEAILGQAVRFTQSIVDEYTVSVAAGEVGENGSATASEDPIIGDRPPTALLYGRVQSGKTAAMVLTAALALDNGFRIIIVLTADNIELVRQTASRFKDLEGPRVLSTLKEDDTSEWKAPDWEATEAEFLEEVERDGLVFVCAKNAFHVPQVLAFLQRISAASYPSLVFDDEADAATPDNTLQARSLGRANAPQHASTIHRRIVENTLPGEEGQSALETLPHSVYVQVTATPFVLILQRDTSRISPNLRALLEPGEGYCGGEEFFGAFNPETFDTPAPPLVLVPERESQGLLRRTVPPTLATSIDFAIVAAAAIMQTRDTWPEGGFKHLSHTSPRVEQHELVAGHIERHLRALRRDLSTNAAEVAGRFERARTELARSLENPPAVPDLMPTITSLIRQAQIVLVNGEAARPPYGPRMNFLVGGNILGRGLTIDDLLTTYYLRQAQTSQMDTVLQHARMYGYRRALMPYTRVFLPRPLAELFKEIHESEQSLRTIVARQDRGEDVPVRIAEGARATRPSALETGALRIYQGAMGQVAPHAAIRDPKSAMEVHRLLVANALPLNEPRQDLRARRIPLEEIKKIVRLMQPVSEDLGRWSPGPILGLLALHADAYRDGGWVYVRPFDAEPDDVRTRARLSGPEVDLLRRTSPTAPALALMYWQREDAPVLWYPTLVLPRDMATYIYGPS
jgi:hypothetical protein